MQFSHFSQRKLFRIFKKCIFSSNRSLDTFISWDNFKKYCENDRIRMQITIAGNECYMVNTNSFLLQQDCGPNDSEVDLRFKNISKVIGVVSDTFNYMGIPFRVEVGKFNRFHNATFGVQLCRMDNNDNEIQVQATFRMRAPLLDRIIDRQIIAKCAKDSTRNGFDNFMAWDELVTKHLKPNGSISMQIELKDVTPKPNNRKRTANDAFDDTHDDLSCSKCRRIQRYSSFRIACKHFYCKDCVFGVRKCNVCNKEFDEYTLKAERIYFGNP